MNCLQIRLDQLADSSATAAYFSQSDALGCDAACLVFDPVVYFSDTEMFRERCRRFAAEAREKRFSAGAVLLTSRAPADRLGAGEAQYDDAGRIVGAGENAFMPSPASAAWLEMLEGLIDTLVGGCGLEWAAIEEPFYAAGLPGVRDRVHDLFVSACPDLPYPGENEETPEYLKLQEVKADSVLRLCRELVQRAADAGAARVGVVPQVFVTFPSGAGIPRTTCEIAQLAQIPGVAFLVSRMTPDTLAGRAADSAGGFSMSAEMCYLEAMAHSLGKPVMCLMDPAAAGKSGRTLDLDSFRDCAHAALAAGASGFGARGFDGEARYPAEWQQLLFEAGRYAGRMGAVSAQAAFVVSGAGARHLPPNDYASVSSHYVEFMRHMLLAEHIPVLTFGASTLRQNLADFPDVRVLIMEEHSPLTVEQMSAVRDWWSGRERRGIVVFCSGAGIAADAESPGGCRCSCSLPGVLGLIGLTQDPDEPVFAPEGGVALRDVSRVRRSAFLKRLEPVRLPSVANVRRAFGSRALTLYDAENRGEPVPVVAEYKDRTTFALYCGFGLNSGTLEAASSAVRYAMREVDAEAPIVTECPEGLLWNAGRTGYLVLSNITGTALTASARPGRSQLWDCRKGVLLSGESSEFTVEPHGFQIYRLVGRRSKFFDIAGVSSLGTLLEGAGRADADIVAGRETVVILRTPPKEALVDGKRVTFSRRIVNGAHYVTLDQCPPGSHRITLKW